MTPGGKDQSTPQYIFPDLNEIEFLHLIPNCIDLLVFKGSHSTYSTKYLFCPHFVAAAKFTLF